MAAVLRGIYDVPMKRAMVPATLAALAAAVLAAGGARRLSVTAVEAPVVETVAEVLAVDAERRTVTIRDARGRRAVIGVPPELRALDAVAPGALVDMSYVPALLLSAGRGRPPFAAEETARLQPRGRRELVVHRKLATARVLELDAARRLLAVAGPDGLRLDLLAPEGVPGFEALRLGDVSALEYADAVALTAAPREPAAAVTGR